MKKSTMMFILTAMFAVSVLAQNNQSLPAVPMPQFDQRALACAGEQVFIAEWSSANIRIACTESNGQVRQNIFVGYAPNVNQVYQKDEAVLFYSGSGRLIQTWNATDPVTGMAQNVYQWRIMGGGRIAGLDGNVLSLNLPWDWENHRFFLYAQANYYSQPTALTNRFNTPCLNVISNTRGDQFCLDAFRNRILRATSRSLFSGPDFQNPDVLLEGEQIVSMGNRPSANDNKLYVLVGPLIEYPELPTAGPVVGHVVKPGRLVEVCVSNDGKVQLNDLVVGVNVDGMRDLQRLAVGKEGIYFPMNQGQKGWSIMKYDFETKTTSVFLPAGDSGFVNPPFIGALAIRSW